MFIDPVNVVLPEIDKLPPTLTDPVTVKPPPTEVLPLTSKVPLRKDTIPCISVSPQTVNPEVAVIAIPVLEAILMTPETSAFVFTVKSSIVTEPISTPDWNVETPATSKVSNWVSPAWTSITDAGKLVLIPILEGRIVKLPTGDSWLLSGKCPSLALSVAMNPNFLQKLLSDPSSPAKTHPKYPPGTGSFFQTISPTLLSPSSDGVPIATVCFLLVLSIDNPFNVISLKSAPWSDVTVSLLLTTKGPLNSDWIILPAPPSTLRLSLTVTSSKITLNLGLSESSPTKVGIGIPIVSSCPVAELSLLLPT